MESEAEAKSNWSRHSAIQVSGVMTLVSGLYANANMPEKDGETALNDARWASKGGIAVGLFWVGLTTALAAGYEPYQDGYKALRNLKVKKGESKMARELLRERMAEEALGKPAGLADRLTLLSIVTNLGASIYIMTTTGLEGQVLAGFSAMAAFSPLIFPHHWSEVYYQHETYKKRIYGPVSSLGFLPIRNSAGRVAPALMVSLQF